MFLINFCFDAYSTKVHTYSFILIERENENVFLFSLQHRKESL